MGDGAVGLNCEGPRHSPVVNCSRSLPAMRYDATLKELFQCAPVRLLELLAGSRPGEILNVEHSSVRFRPPYLVLRLADGRLYHLELQLRGAGKLARRADPRALLPRGALVAPRQYQVGVKEPTLRPHRHCRRRGPGPGTGRSHDVVGQPGRGAPRPSRRSLRSSRSPGDHAGRCARQCTARYAGFRPAIQK